MIVDTSALIAILSQESDGAVFAQRIYDAPICRISAAGLLELSIVLHSRGGLASLEEGDALIQNAQIIVEPVTAEQAYLARQAFFDYGKGCHPAALNFGDCFSYALAKATEEPLLFKGNDFSQTDIQSAYYPPAA